MCESYYVPFTTTLLSLQLCAPPLCGLCCCLGNRLKPESPCLSSSLRQSSAYWISQIGISALVALPLTLITCPSYTLLPSPPPPPSFPILFSVFHACYIVLSFLFACTHVNNHSFCIVPSTLGLPSPLCSSCHWTCHFHQSLSVLLAS